MAGKPVASRTVLVLPAWYPSAREPLAGPFVRDHVRAAAGVGHRIAVVADDGSRAGVRGLFSLMEERDGPVQVFRLAYRPRMGSLTYVPGVLAVARRLAHAGTPIDVVHAHVHWMGWPAVIIGALLRTPVVISEHSSEWTRRSMRPGAVRRARIAFRRAALVCPVNEQLQHAIESYGIHARFRVVPNAVDTRVFHPSASPRDREPSRLVNVALHVEVKALDVLLRAFASLGSERPGLTLELIGDGPLTADLRRLAAELRVAERVRFSGRKTPEEIADALRGSDVFVLSSRSENMPLAVIEALCCGIPVAATEVGGVPAAVGTSGALAPTGDPERLAAAIATVLDQYRGFDARAIAARAADAFSFDAVGRVWDEIYRSV